MEIEPSSFSIQFYSSDGLVGPRADCSLGQRRDWLSVAYPNSSAGAIGRLELISATSDVGGWARVYLQAGTDPSVLARARYYNAHTSGSPKASDNDWPVEHFVVAC